MMNKLLLTSSLITLCVAAVSCQASPSSTRGNPELAAAFREAVEMMNGSLLPAAQRPPLDRERFVAVKQKLDSPAGVEYLAAQVDSQPDETVALCVTSLLAGFKEPSAGPALERLTHHENPSVAKYAQIYSEVREVGQNP